ncbi:alpha-1,2-fucosyltransferase [Bradyrhizobium prioriisuperbiae]|uniref:alpha-1,2-fucosyltransferase n=1 Tax=Bradyrhizobium prioriisuperbiae TaxID=2854389 RepID=UPI0028F145DB|nr:alpha-1,2-fucosyltransferase [Bradyrhizobium prioritasuperba]
MITIAIQGGLGNQMFQYAAAKALACRHGVDLVIDESSFRSYTLRNFLLDRLQVPEAVADRVIDASSPVKSFTAVKWRNRANRILSRLSLPELPQRGNTYSEPHFHFDSRFTELGASTSLFGYFQSERYFIEIADMLRDCFQPRDPIGPPAQAMADVIARSEMPVSVHIRRGDYVKSAETARVHGSLSAPYYRTALQVLQGALPSPMTVFVFSDDPAEAEAVLDFVPRDQLVHVSGDPERPWEDMALMSRCRHHVIANSSFSWWGAWLNPAPEKIVIAPREWFTPAELRQRNTCDLYPPGWILL